MPARRILDAIANTLLLEVTGSGPERRAQLRQNGRGRSSLAVVCAAKGHTLWLVTVGCFLEETISTMRVLGAEVDVLLTPEGRRIEPLGERAEANQKETGAHWTDQVRNAHQLDGHATMGGEVAERPGLKRRQPCASRVTASRTGGPFLAHPAA